MISLFGLLAWLLRPVHSLALVLVALVGLVLASPLLLLAFSRDGKSLFESYHERESTIIRERRACGAVDHAEQAPFRHRFALIDLLLNHACVQVV